MAGGTPRSPGPLGPGSAPLTPALPELSSGVGRPGPPRAPLPTTPRCWRGRAALGRRTRRPGPHTPRPNIRPWRGPETKKKDK